MRFALRVAAGFVVAFLVQAIISAGAYRVLGQDMLQRAGWTPGAIPPTSYMTFSIIVAFVAGATAGVVGALIVGRARIRYGLACGVLLTAITAWANRATLLGSPHPYEWPLVLAPLVALPLGAYLIVHLRPLRPAT